MSQIYFDLLILLQMSYCLKTPKTHMKLNPRNTLRRIYFKSKLNFQVWKCKLSFIIVSYWIFVSIHILFLWPYMHPSIHPYIHPSFYPWFNSSCVSWNLQFPKLFFPPLKKVMVCVCNIHWMNFNMHFIHPYMV